MPDPELEIVTIFESDDPVAFSLATSVLDEAGVEYAVVEDGRPGFGLTPMVSRMRRIQIPAYRKEQALELMERAAGLNDPLQSEDDSSADEQS
jgi:antitoxin (DNA-binding transcriptional repressor) of toxin-antitoxin stability system